MGICCKAASEKASCTYRARGTGVSPENFATGFKGSKKQRGGS